MTVWRVPVRGLVLGAGIQLDFPVPATGRDLHLSIGDGLAIEYADSKRRFGIVRSVARDFAVIEVGGKYQRIRPASVGDKLEPATKDHVAWIVVAGE